MEEQKKTVSIAQNASQQSEQKKPTYEELNNYCVQLFNQNKQLVAQLQEMNAANLFKRLDYLFLVIQNKEAFSREKGFYDTCVHEIREALTIEENKEAKAEKK